MTRTSTVLRAGRADPLELAFLQHAQELDLDVRRQVADLVEEDRAAVGQLEAPGPHRDGAGERALFVSEQLALDQRRRQRRAVDAHERAGMPAAAIVQRAREQFLAGAGRPEQQHAGVGRRHLRQPRQRQAQRRALADDVVEVVIALDLFLQVARCRPRAAS